MKISSTAIRQKTFETAFRGYEKKQVADFLEEMSVTMEQINQENLDLRSRLQQVESEAKRLKDVEDSLFRTLKTAEDTGAAIITEATEAADQIIGEANQLAEEATKDAQRYAEELRVYSAEQARLVTQAAEDKAKETIKVLSENMSSLVKSYDALVEQREALVKSLRRLSQDALNQIDLSETHFTRIDAKAYHRAVEDLGRANYFSVANLASLAPTPEPVIAPASEEAPVVHLDLYSAEEEALLKGAELNAEVDSFEEEEFDRQDEELVAELEETKLEEELYEEEIEEIEEEEELEEDDLEEDELDEELEEDELDENEIEEDELDEDELEEEIEEEDIEEEIALEEAYNEEKEEEVAPQAAASQPEVADAPAPSSSAPFAPENPKEDESKPGSGSFFDQFD
jgi:cell division initiation protein